jgi:hypothetical protein
LCPRQEIRRAGGLAELGGDRHRFCDRNEADADGAYRRGSYRIFGKAKESATVGGVHHLLLLKLRSPPHGLKRV